MLDIGCGSACQAGFVGMDKRELPGVQVVHDLEQFPYPLEDESCAVVMASHVVEHIKPWFQIDMMNELWRILECGGRLAVSTPYGGSFRYLQDPTHCTPWVEATPYYFAPIEGNALYEVYRPKPWKIERLYWDKRGDIECLFEKVAE